MQRLLKAGKRFLTDADYRFRLRRSLGLCRGMPDEVFLSRYFQAMHGYPLNLEHPETFSEKLQWLKLHDRNPAYTQMVDKAVVKRIVAEKAGDEYIIPTLGLWDRAEDIDFDALPDRFVLKCTHDSHGLILCRDKQKLDREAARRTLSRALKRDYYSEYREWPYRDVKPRILAEAYMDDDGRDLADYKFHCFHGEPRVILVCAGRFSPEGLTEDFYDCDWNHLDVKRPKIPLAAEPLPRPEKLEEMLDVSRRLSEGIPFVRVDLYLIRGQVYFGELTFYPTSGFAKFDPESFDRELGGLLTLPGMEDSAPRCGE